MCAATGIAWRFVEPPRPDQARVRGGQIPAMRAALGQPVLRWMFALAVVMYGFSHLPFVFGQPFILSALDRVGCRVSCCWLLGCRLG
jgi:hypothetical protein